MFDGYTAEDLDPFTKRATREGCQKYVEQYLEDCTEGFNINKYNRNASNIIGGWANAFIANVNWQEIANHLNDEASENESEPKEPEHISEILNKLGMLT